MKLDCDDPVSDEDVAAISDRVEMLTHRFSRTESAVVSIRKKNNWFKSKKTY
jgi:hypothetical protein